MKLTKKLLKEWQCDIKNGYYEIIDGLEIEQGLLLTILSEREQVYVSLMDLREEDIFQGFYRVDKKEFLEYDLEKFNQITNAIYYYCMEPMED